MGQRVLKFDGPSGRGLWIARRAILIKSALRDILSVSYGIVSILVISRFAAPPYPVAPDFLHGKACHTILRSLCSLTNRVPLPPHPGDRINRSMLSCRDMAPWLNTHNPTTKWGEGGGASHQRGNAFPRPSGRLYSFSRQRRHKKWRRRRRTSPAQRYYITPEGGALNPPVRRQPITGRTLGAQGQRPGGAINPHARKGVSTFGNTGKHHPLSLLNPQAP